MTYCPNCGSEHIQLKQGIEVNWGRAIVGFALFGIVGGVVRAIKEDDEVTAVCVNC